MDKICMVCGNKNNIVSSNEGAFCADCFNYLRVQEIAMYAYEEWLESQSKFNSFQNGADSVVLSMLDENQSADNKALDKNSLMTKIRGMIELHLSFYGYPITTA